MKYKAYIKYQEDHRFRPLNSQPNLECSNTLEAWEKVFDKLANWKNGSFELVNDGPFIKEYRGKPGTHVVPRAWIKLEMQK